MKAQMAGYTIELLVNNVVQPRYTITRYHDASARDVMTCSGTAKIILNKNDIVSIRVTPLSPNIYLQHKLDYTIARNGTTLKAERLQVW